jgi:flagellar hook-associated protein 1 FlgK
MSGTLLGTAISGLAAFQRSLETTSHNISNVNTEGYSRQRAELATRPAQFTGAGYIGKGVNVTNISRSYDQFVTNQLRSSTSTFGEVDKFHSLSSQIDNIIADENTGMSPALKSFFNAVNEVADDPSSIPARQVMITESELLSQHFNTMNARFSEIRNQVNNDLTLTVDDINSIASTLADMNVKIVADTGQASGQQLPNDVLDQRDVLLSKLSEKIDVSVVYQDDGSANVFIGKGQALVLGTGFSKLSVESAATDPLQKEIHMSGQDISRQLSGGELSGYLRFRDEVLDPSQQRLGLLAAGIAVEFNELHKQGFDLNGVAGADVFGFGTPEIPVVDLVSTAGGSVTATYKTSAANLEATDYQIDVTGTGPTTFTITRLSDNSTVTAASVGFDVAFTGVMTVGDSFFVRPTFQAANTISAQITDPREIAASQTAATVPGDNRIALQLADLQSQSTLLGGKATFSETYGQIISSVGSQTHAARVSRSAQDVLLSQAQKVRESISGVNLDEEAANLIKFQNSYQAAAQSISVARTLFDTLIGAVR